MTDIPWLFDPGPVAAIQRLLGLGWPTPWRVVSLLGTNWGILLVLGLAFWLWGRRLALGVLAVVVVDGVLKMGLNQLVHVARPDAGSIVKYEHVGVGSFPSGHVSTTTGLWSFLSLRGRVPWLISAAIVVLESISRLYLGVHFVGDVLGGILLGLVVLGLVHVFWPATRRALARVPTAVWQGAAVLTVVGVAVAAALVFADNPYQWRAGGLVAGLAVGLPMEYRWVRYEPAPGPAGRKALQAIVGAAGIGALAAPDVITGEESGPLGLVVTALAGVWVTLAAPALFVALDWGRRQGGH